MGSAGGSRVTTCRADGPALNRGQDSGASETLHRARTASQRTVLDAADLVRGAACDIGAGRFVAGTRAASARRRDRHDGSAMEGGAGRSRRRWKAANALPFNPSIEVEPDEHSASTPTGLNVDVRVPQANTLSASSLAEADVKDTTVTLPEGVQLSPGAADGSPACSAAEIGLLEGFAESQQTENDHFSADPPDCPEEAGAPSAKVGTVRIRTPLLANELEGGVYLAQQGTDPFQPPLVLYVIARDPVSGVLVKLAGKITPDPVSGRLVSSFENTPPLPFEELQLHFFNGPRASVSTPPLCGDYATTSSFTPWSATAPATPSSRLSDQPPAPVRTAARPTPSRSLRPFRPARRNLQAGAFTPFIAEHRPPRSRSAAQRDHDAPAHRPGRDPGLGEALPRTAGRRRSVRSGKPDRAHQHELGPWHEPLHSRGPGVSHRPLRWCAVRPVDRDSCGCGPVRPRAGSSCGQRSTSTPTRQR